MSTTIAIFGAAGNMGTRACNALKDAPEYRLLYVEAGENGQERLRQRGLTATPPAEALPQADVVLLAVPDAAIGAVARKVVPELRAGAMVICLDPAAPYGGPTPRTRRSSMTRRSRRRGGTSSAATSPARALSMP